MAHVRRRHAGAHQPRHPPAPRAAHAERSRPHQADEQPAPVDAGIAGGLLRRRARHGRQHLSRRPQRRAHAHAMESRPQCRLLALRSAAPVSAADHGSDLRLRSGERRGAAARSGIAPQLDEAHARGAQAKPCVRPRQPVVPASRQPQGAGLPPRAEGRGDPLRRQSIPGRSTG